MRLTVAEQGKWVLPLSNASGSWRDCAANPVEHLIATAPEIGSELANRIHETLGIETLEELEASAYEGIILIGPFNCLPFRISEAILKPLSIQRGTARGELTGTCAIRSTCTPPRAVW